MSRPSLATGFRFLRSGASMRFPLFSSGAPLLRIFHGGYLFLSGYPPCRFRFPHLSPFQRSAGLIVLQAHSEKSHLTVPNRMDKPSPRLHPPCQPPMPSSMQGPSVFLRPPLPKDDMFRGNSPAATIRICGRRAHTLSPTLGLRSLPASRDGNAAY